MEKFGGNLTCDISVNSWPKKEDQAEAESI